MAGYRLTAPDPRRRKPRGGLGRRRHPAGVKVRARAAAAHRSRPRALAESRYRAAKDPAERLAVAYSYLRSALAKYTPNQAELDRLAEQLLVFGHRTFAGPRRPAAEIRARRARRRANQRHRR